MAAPRPVWLDDEPAIGAWLHKALDRLDAQPAEQRSEPLRFRAPEALGAGRLQHGPDTDGRWELVKSLCGMLPLSITRPRRREEFAHDYDGAKLVLGTACEETLREWLRRPRCTPEVAEWQAAVDGAATPWPEEGRARLRARSLLIPGRSAAAVVGAFGKMGQCAGLSLRQLSARLFFGDSKFLETREALVQALYPELAIAPRPLLVAVSLPERIRGVLFVENHDSYLGAASGRWPEAADLAIVYAAGFKGGAARIRAPGNAVMHYRGSDDTAPFEGWWFRQQQNEWPVWFWGDLDWSGMQILKGMRDQFGAGAWQPGYEPMVKLLREGGGHLPEAAEKESQRPLDATGCPYADGTLLPVLRSSGRFLDQEAGEFA